MTNWLCTLTQVKSALQWNTSLYDAVIADVIQSVSDGLFHDTHRYWIPVIQTRYYPWPAIQPTNLYRLWLDQDILEVDHIKVRSQDPSPITFATDDYWLEPINRPPYDRVEINLAKNSTFDPGTAWQRSIEIAGTWGWDRRTRPAGTINGALDNTATTFTISNGSLVEVGHTLLVDQEHMFVSSIGPVDSTATLTNAIANNSRGVVSLTVSDGTLLNVGEEILIDSEWMMIQEITGTLVTVQRGNIEGTLVGSHLALAPIYVNRQITVERGDATSGRWEDLLNGTTPAAHTSGTLLRKYVIDGEMNRIAIGDSIVNLVEQKSGYGRTVGPSTGANSGNRWDARWDSNWWLHDREETIIQHTRFLYGAV